jgi:hypothetical protein
MAAPRPATAHALVLTSLTIRSTRLHRMSRTDLAVYRGTTGQWFIDGSPGGPLQFGTPALGDVPIATAVVR